MGRRVEKKRRISDDRVGKSRIPKSKILIAVEGNNKTEKIYFSNFDNGKKKYSISFARGNYTDPLNLVKMLIKEIDKIGLDLDGYDEAYCVFDVDTNIVRNSIIAESKKLASANNIKIVTSTPSIELWFLLHYEYTSAGMTNRELITRLRKFLPTYDKNINVYNYIFENTNTAVLRAKKLIKYQLENKKTIGTVEANPCTEIYQLVERLLDEKR